MAGAGYQGVVAAYGDIQKALGKYYYLPNGTDKEIAAATSSALAAAKTE